MFILGLRKGKTPCDDSCPFYEPSGLVRGFGGKLRTPCRAVMHPWLADCNQFDMRRIDKIRVTEAVWKKMQKGGGVKAIRQRKLYPEDHQPIHPIGWKPQNSKLSTRSDRT